jgi:adenylate cyclase
LCWHNRPSPYEDALPFAHSLLSLVYVQKQQYDQAVAEGERALALDPNNANSYAMQAYVLNAASGPQEALQLVERAMRLNPHYSAVYLLSLGSAYRATGRSTEAIAVLKEALNRSPNLMPAHFTLAASYLLQWVAQQSPAAQPLAQAFAAAQRALAL